MREFSVYSANIALESYSILICLILVFYHRIYMNIHKKQKYWFIAMLLFNAGMMLGEMSVSLFNGMQGMAASVFLCWGMCVFYAFFPLLLYSLVRYLIELMELRTVSAVRIRRIAAWAASMHVLCSVLSLWNGMFFYLAEGNVCMRGPFFSFSQMIPFFLYLLSSLLIWLGKGRLSLRSMIFLFSHILFPAAGQLLYIFIDGGAYINILSTLALFLIHINVQSEQEYAVKTAKEELNDLQIHIMLSQIRPHFLYNSLTAIRQLCDTDTEQAKKSILDFSRFLRANMNSLTTREPIPFDRELEHTRSYLSLEQQRFGEKLRVVYDINSHDFLVPTLTLQPIVENAVRHGICNREEGGTVKIYTEEWKDGNVIVVSDDGAGMKAASDLHNDSGHIGISNVRRRLETQCGGSMMIKSDENGTVVTMWFPHMNATGGGYKMRFLLVDDEKPALCDLEKVLRTEEPETELCCFTSPSQALSAAAENEFSVAFLDIEMGTMDGITMARKLKDLQPGIHIIFVTSHECYALDAFSVHATGYLLKPVSIEDIRRELTFLYQERKISKRIQVRTFGGFDIFVDGKPLSFKRTKSKELLAYLIDRRGCSVTLRNAADILFEDGQYDLSRRKYMQTIYAELRSTLQEAGAEGMLKKHHNSYAVDIEAFDCDSYRFLNGDPIAINNYRHDYMICYSWAEYSMGELEK